MPRAPLFEGPARRRAQALLADDVKLLQRVGFSKTRMLGPLLAEVSGDGPLTLRVQMAREGRVFGGNYALEVSTARPVLPRTRGLSARGQGLVRMHGVSFHAHRGDDAGRALAARLEGDRELVERLSAVHFERIRVEPDGTPVIRHMGGSIVWILFPPLVRRIPLIPEQAKATVRAFEAFAALGAGRAG